MKDDDSGVPSHWETTSLEEIAEVRLGRQRSPDRAHGDHMRPYMRAANVTWNGINLHDVKEMDFTPKEFEAYELRRGDILLSEASGSASEVGKPAIWKGDVPNCCFQNTLIRVRADESLARFLLLHFTKDAVTGAFAAASRGVGIHHLGAKALCEWEIRLPPLGEQERIVEAVESYFSRLDDAVATLEGVERNLKRYRASVLKSAVEGRLVPTEAALAKQEGRNYEPASVLLERILSERRRRWSESGKKGKYQEPTPPDTTNLPCLPKGWCWATADTLCEQIVDCHNKTAPYVEDGIPLLRTTNIREGSLKLDDLRYVTEDTYSYWSRRCPPLPGDVLFTREAPMGEAAIVPERMKICMGQRMMLLRADPRHVFPRYLLLAVQAPHILNYATRRAVGIGVPHLRVRDVENLPIPVPPLPEQLRIISEAEQQLALIAAIGQAEHSIARRCTRLRQSLLRWAFEGKLVDQDHKDEPASVLLARIKVERDTTKPAKTAKLTKDTKPAKATRPQRVAAKVAKAAKRIRA